VLDWREENPHWITARGAAGSATVKGSVSIAGAEVVAARRAGVPGEGIIYGELPATSGFILCLPGRDGVRDSRVVSPEVLLDRLSGAPKQARWFIGFCCEPQEFLVDAKDSKDDFTVVLGGKNGGGSRRVIWLAVGSARLWREWYDWGVRGTNGRSMGAELVGGSTSRPDAASHPESDEEDDEAGGKL